MHRTRILTLIATGLTVFGVLTACEPLPAPQPSKPPSYTFVAPPTSPGRLCIDRCAQTSNTCLWSARLSQGECKNRAHDRAMRDYDQYVREQYFSGQAMDLHPEDFERTQTCEQDFSNSKDACENSYRDCYTECGGQVTLVQP